MVIQPIPPFKGKKSQQATQPSNSSTQATTKSSGSGPGAQSSKNAEAAKADSAANKLNVNATSFRPNPKALAFTPVISYRCRPCKESLTHFIAVSGFAEHGCGSISELVTLTQDQARRCM
jgi:hypothetical protein